MVMIQSMLNKCSPGAPMTAADALAAIALLEGSLAVLAKVGGKRKRPGKGLLVVSQLSCTLFTALSGGTNGHVVLRPQEARRFAAL